MISYYQLFRDPSDGSSSHFQISFFHFLFPTAIRTFKLVVGTSVLAGIKQQGVQSLLLSETWIARSESVL